MLMDSIKTYCVLVFSFLSLPCFAHFTYDIVSHTMSSYLSDLIDMKLKTLESQYENHFHTFNEKEKRKIEKKLRGIRARLNQIPKILIEKKNEYNKRIDLYNNLMAQLKSQKQERQELQNKLNEAIQEIRKQDKLRSQVVSFVQQLNMASQSINEKIDQLSVLQDQLTTALKFYENAEYLLKDSIVQLKEDLIQWNISEENNLNAKKMDYEKKLESFKEWEQTQKQLIEEQRIQVDVKKQALNQFVDEVNPLINEYNEAVQKGCKKQRCVDELLSKKSQIEEKKKEQTEQAETVSHLMLDMNQKEESYNKQHEEYINKLNVLKEELESLSRLISLTQEQKKKEWEEQIQIESMSAKRKRDEIQKQFNQLQLSLNEEYGGHFENFVKKFSYWLNINRPVFQSFNEGTVSQEGTDQMHINNDSLCGYSTFQPSTETGFVCDLVTQIHTLLENIVSNDVSPEDWEKQLDQKEQKIESLTRELDIMDRENKQLKFQLDAQIQEHNKKIDERTNRYKQLSEQIQTKLNKQLEKMRRSYELKGQLLVKEYELIYYLLFVPDDEKESKTLDGKWTDFQSMQEAFMSSLPENVGDFPIDFMETAGIIFSVMQKAEENTSPLVKLSSTANIGTLPIKQIEGKNKKQVVSSWMNTAFISGFLQTTANQISGLLVESSTGMNNSQIFIERLFLESVYQLVPVRQAVKNNLLRYQIIFDNRIFWILSEGKLEIPKGFYQ